MSEAVAGLKRILKEFEQPALTTKKCEAVVKKLFSEKSLIKKGHSLRLRQIEIEKEQRLGNRIGPKCLKLVKEAVFPAPSENGLNTPSLKDRISSHYPEIQKKALVEGKSLVQQVRFSANEKLVINGIILACAIAGLLVIFLFPELGIPALAITLVLLGISFAFFSIDFYKLTQALKEDHFEKYDKKALIMSSVLCVLTMAISVTLTLTLAFSPWSLLFLATGVLWLGMNGYTWKVLSAHDLKYRQENPTVEFFAQMLRSKNAQPELVKRVFTNLSHEDQKAIKRSLWKKYMRKLSEGYFKTDPKSVFFDDRYTQEDLSFAAMKYLRKLEKIKEAAKRQADVEFANTKASLVPLINAFIATA